MKLLFRYLILIVCLFISSCYFNLFEYPNKIVIGGIGGITIIINNIFKISPSVIILIISFILLVLSYFTLGLRKTSGALISTFVYPYFINLTRNINYYIHIDINNLLLISIILGILCGITSGIIYKIGLNNGGLNIISETLYKYKNISLSKTTFWINFIIVLIGSINFGINNLIYAIIILIINSLIIKALVKS